MLLTESATTLS